MAKGFRPLTAAEQETRSFLDRGEVPPGDHPIYSCEEKQLGSGRRWFVTIEVSAETTRLPRRGLRNPTS